MTDDLVGRNGLCYEWLYASYTSNFNACGLLVYKARTVAMNLKCLRAYSRRSCVSLFYMFAEKSAKFKPYPSFPKRIGQNE
jgi:hypothetical protein